MSLSNVFLGIFFFFLGRLWKWVMQHVPRMTMMAISAVFIGLFIYFNIHYHGEYDMSLNQYVQRPVGAIVNSILALCGFAGILLSLPMKRVPFVNFIGEHKQLFDELIQQSNRYKDVLMPGYTHLQVAMPSSFGLW